MARPPRLAIVTSHPIQYQSPLFRRLTERGHVRPTVLYLSDHGMTPSEDTGFGRAVRFDVDLVGGFEHLFVPNRSLRPSVSKPLGLVNPALVEMLDDRYGAVLVHGHAHVSAWIAYAAAWGRNVPYLLRGESHPLRPDAPRAKRVTKHRLLDPLVRNAGACLAIGSRNAAFYRDHGANSDRIVDSPYCVDNEYFEVLGKLGEATRREWLSALGLEPDRPTILFTAKLLPRKRPLDLVAAHRLMRRKANLVLIGDGVLRPEIEKALEGRPDARLLGFQNQSQVGRWYGVADIFVLPSGFDRWGLAVNEAMAGGAVPVVSDVVGCAPDLVEPGAGRTFPVGDVAALAGVLDELVADDALLARLRANARVLLERHSLDAAAEGLELGFETAVRHGGARRRTTP